jgi:hypothetical protein
VARRGSSHARQDRKTRATRPRVAAQPGAAVEVARQRGG